MGQINGGTIQLLVDTGATVIAIPSADARRLGINYLTGQRGFTETANGKAAAYRQGADPPLGATMAHLTAGLLGDVLVLGQPHASLVARELLRDRAARRVKPAGERLTPLSDLRAKDELLDATEQARRACGRGQRDCRRPAAQTKRTKVKQCGLRLLS